MIKEYNEKQTEKLNRYIFSTVGKTLVPHLSNVETLSEINKYELAFLEFNKKSKIIGAQESISELEMMAGFKGNPEKCEEF